MLTEVPHRLRLRLARFGYFRGAVLMSELRKRWVLLRNPHVTISFGRQSYVGPGFVLHAPFGGTLLIGDSVELRRNIRIELGEVGTVTFGARSVCTYDTVFQCSTTITVGEHCTIGQCVIVDGSHRFRDHSRPMLEQGLEVSPLTIAKGATVMSKVTVIADLGEGCFVGANAVVTRPIPPYCLAVGVPARPIEYFGPGQAPVELT